MKQNSNRRSRSRGGSKKSHGRNSYDSNGPAGKVRGTAQQVLEKYQLLGRDAASSGEWIMAESCMQYAEHYFRIVSSEVAVIAESNNQNQEIKTQDNAVSADDQTTKKTVAVPIVEASTNSDLESRPEFETQLSQPVTESDQPAPERTTETIAAGGSGAQSKGNRRRRVRPKSEFETSSTQDT